MTTAKQRAQRWIDAGIDPTSMRPDDFKPRRGPTMSQATFEAALKEWRFLRSVQSSSERVWESRTLTPVEVPLGEPASEGTYSRTALDLLSHPLRVRTLPLGEAYLRELLSLDGEQYCWEIDLKRGGCVRDGYGYAGGWALHRLSWVWWHGPIPDGYVIDHVCGNRRCFYPAHLDAIPPSENANAVRKESSRHPYPEDLTVGSFVGLTRRNSEGEVSYYRTDGAKRIAAARKREALDRRNERQRERYRTDAAYAEKARATWREHYYGTDEARDEYNRRRRERCAADPESGRKAWERQRNDPEQWEKKKARDRARNQRAKTDPELKARLEAAARKHRAKKAAKRAPAVRATQKRILAELLSLPTPVRPKDVNPALARLGLRNYPWREALGALGWQVEEYYATITLESNYGQQVEAKAYRFIKEED